MPLTDRSVKLAEPREKTYKVSDSGGLYIEINPKGAKYWRLKYRFAGKEKRLALGVYPDVSLKKAREDRDDAKRLLSNGIDPGEKRKEQKLALKGYYDNTFAEVALEWRTIKMSDRSDSYMVKVESALRRDVLPFIGDKNISRIEAPEILHLLRKIEARGAIETAHRTKMWIGQVFYFAIATGRCQRNPTLDLKGALKPHKPQHFAAITDATKVGKLMSDIYHYSGTPQVTAALKCTALWFLRQIEVRNLEWDQVKWDKEQLEIQAAKGGEDHIVPLSTQSIQILKDLYVVTGHGKKVFPGARSHEKGISENTVNAALRNLGYEKEVMSAHGFRAMARTLLEEELEFDAVLPERQLAHKVKDALGRAYNRTQLLKARREMMQRWSDYLDELRLQYEKDISRS